MAFDEHLWIMVKCHRTNVLPNVNLLETLNIFFKNKK